MILTKNNQFKFYKENYEKIKKENEILMLELKSSQKSNEILNQTVNNYLETIKMFKNSYKFSLQDIKSDKRRILFVLHSGSGGTPKTVNDLVKNIYNEYECYLLTSDSHMMKLFLFNGKNFDEIESVRLYSEWLIENCYNDEYLNIYFNFFVKYSFDMVHIHHLIFHSFDIVNLCKELNVPLILSIHDLYFICPAYNLLDGDFKYCGGNCSNSNSDKNCFIPMQDITKVENMKNFVDKWRISVFEMFTNVDNFIMPSNFIKDMIVNNYSIDEIKIHIIEHGIDYNCRNKKLFEIPNINEPVKILFLGNLYPQKGVSIIKKLHEVDHDKNFEFHFLGYAPEELSNIGINHGVYDNDYLKEHIEQIKPSFIGIFTLCGESYCYTLSESWAFGIPVLATKLGALKERILKNGGGWFIDIDDIEGTYNQILSIVNDLQEYKSKLEDIQNISLVSTKSMSEKYLDIYNIIK